MSCNACDEFQDQDRCGTVGEYFIRVGVANIKIVGCREHVEATMDAIRKGTKP